MADEIEKEVLRVQRDAAQEVAGQTALERDMALAQRNAAAAQRDVVVGQRDAAHQYAVTEEAEARSSSTGFYVLLTAVAIALLILAAVYLGKGGTQQGSDIVINRQTPVVPPAALSPPVSLAPNSSAPSAPPLASVPAQSAPVVVNSAPAPRPIVIVAPSQPPSNAVPSAAPLAGSSAADSAPTPSSTPQAAPSDTSSTTSTTTTTTTTGGAQ